MKKTLAMILALIMSLSLLTACGGGGDAPEGGAPSGGDDKPAATEVRDDINLTLIQTIQSLNPFNANNIVTCQLFCQIYETMFFFNDSGELEPRVCVEYTPGADGQTHTVKINPDAKFHNGQPVTAEDVAWSLQYCFKDGPYAVWRSRIPNLESAVAIDETTVEIKSTDVDSSFFNKLCIFGYICSKDEFLAAEAKGTLGVEWAPMGTGPYMVTSYSPDTVTELVAFSDYYRGEASIKNIKYTVLTDNNTITTSFESGDLDYIVVPTASWASISSNENYNSRITPTVHTSFFMLNSVDEGPLADKRVRQAIGYAIDREAMAAVAYDNLAQPAYSMYNPDTVVGGYTPEELKAAGIEPWEYNPEKAKALLAEAGYPNGFETDILSLGASYWPKMSNVLQAQLAEVGITATVTIGADDVGSRQYNQEYEISTMGTEYVPDISTSRTFYAAYTEEEKAAGNRTMLGLYDLALEDTYTQIKQAKNDEEKKEAFLNQHRILQDEAYTIPTFHKTIPYAWDKDLVCDEINTGYYYVYNFHWN